MKPSLSHLVSFLFIIFFFKLSFAQTAPLGNSPQSFCSADNATLADLLVEGTDITFWDAPLGNQLADSTLLIDDITYYVTQGTAIAAEILEVLVYIEDVIEAPEGDSDQYFCSTIDWTLADLAVFNTTGFSDIFWFADSNQTTILPLTTILVNGTTYYAFQNISSCAESVAVTIQIITDTPSPIGASDQYFCSADNPTLADLVVLNTTGFNDIFWFADPNQTTILSSATLLIDGTAYYAFQSVGSCTEALVVTVHMTIPAPTGESNQYFCAADTLADVLVFDTFELLNIFWYSEDNTSGIQLPLSTLLVDGSTYYAFQGTGSCAEPLAITTHLLNNTIDGIISLDPDNNGCDTNDLRLSNIMVTSDNGTETFSTFTQTDGTFSLCVNEGNFTTTIAEVPNYYSISPSLHTSNFSGSNNSYIADFCINSTQTINDVNINVIPSSEIRPGFNVSYTLIYKNVGTTILDGNVQFDYDSNKLEFLDASETIDIETDTSLTFNYYNLEPFETRIITVNFTVFTIPTVNIGDIINFTATVNPTIEDYTIDDNVLDFHQTVVGSFDPNDIHILEGPQIRMEDSGKYLHYLIRFENTGTADAINIVVKNKLDANLDWTTLQLEKMSHNGRVEILESNQIKFIFDDINLPSDETNSHGYIAYKIKPKYDIVIGDVIKNQASIYFDFNPAVNTNIARTEIVNNTTVSVNDISLSSLVNIYPNPTNGILHIETETIQIVKLKVYSNFGQLVVSKNDTNINQINLSKLLSGLYFIKLEDKNGNTVMKKILVK